MEQDSSQKLQESFEGRRGGLLCPGGSTTRRGDRAAFERHPRKGLRQDDEANSRASRFRTELDRTADPWSPLADVTSCRNEFVPDGQIVGRRRRARGRNRFETGFQPFEKLQLLDKVVPVVAGRRHALWTSRIDALSGTSWRNERINRDDRSGNDRGDHVPQGKLRTVGNVVVVPKLDVTNEPGLILRNDNCEPDSFSYERSLRSKDTPKSPLKSLDSLSDLQRLPDGRQIWGNSLFPVPLGQLSLT